MKRNYFPALDTLRAFAALSVIWEHINSWSITLNGHPAELQPFTLLFLSGWDAVTLFFVLSGFLITYLLLLEKHNTNTVNVRGFYFRRALRIWPVYYLVTFVGFAIYPLLFGRSFDLTGAPAGQIVLSALMLPNVATSLYYMSIMGHLWSIGTEEQMYAVLPLIIRRVRRVASLPRLLIAFIIVKLALNLLIDALNAQNAAWYPLYDLIRRSRFECMAVGALAAYVFIYKPALIRLINAYPLRVLTVIVVVLAAIAKPGQNPFTDLTLALVFAALVLQIAVGNQQWLKRTLPMALGRISYGLYLYHMLVLYLVLRLMATFPPGIPYLLILYAAVVIGTTALGALSHRFLETPFLRLRDRSLDFSLLRPRFTLKRS